MFSQFYEDLCDKIEKKRSEVNMYLLQLKKLEQAREVRINRFLKSFFSKVLESKNSKEETFLFKDRKGGVWQIARKEKSESEVKAESNSFLKGGLVDTESIIL